MMNSGLQSATSNGQREESPLVNFLICGTQKGGTSALDAYLRDHPEICMATQKEVHFFDNEELFFNCRKPDYSRYHAAFTPQPEHRMIGEATPIYMYWQEAPRRIWEYNPHMKLIVLLRNPIERAFSHWNMERSRHAETLPFWEAIQNEARRCRVALPYQHRVYSYIDRGFYSEQIRRLWHYFPPEQVLILKTEYLRDQPEACLKDVCEFLGVSNFPTVIPRSVHTRPYVAPMSPKEKAYLHRIYEYEIKTLERMLGWNCSDWLSL